MAAITLTVLSTPTPSFADEVRDGQWYLDELRVDDAHEMSQGEGVTIGVVDGGVDASHPDLRDNVEEGADFGDSTGNGLNDPNGHGTSIASLLVGHGHGSGNADGVLGIAPRAKVISAGMNCKQECHGGKLISEAIKWLVDQDVDIISVSLGASDDNNEALDYAVSKGVAVVGSAGNDEFEDHDILGQVKASSMTHWPARARGAIPVSGTTEDGEFWDRSLTLKSAAPQPQLGLSAPAESITTADKGGGYATHSGTSGSVPIVAGTLALIKSAYPDLSYNQWIDRLLDTVDDKGPKGFDDKYGWGIVNPQRALTEETTYEGKDGDQVSSPDDRLPLAEQGKDSGAKGDEDEKNSSDDDGLLGNSSSYSTFLIVGIVAGVIVAAAVLTTIIVVTKRRRVKFSALQGRG